MSDTTNGIYYRLCSYCGLHHNYSEQMCKDMTNRGPLPRPIPKDCFNCEALAIKEKELVEAREAIEAAITYINAGSNFSTQEDCLNYLKAALAGEEKP